MTQRPLLPWQRLSPWQRLKWPLTGLAMLLIALPAGARDEPPSSPESTRAYRDGYNLILNAEWSAAIQAFEQLMQQHPDSGWVDDAAFWRCYAGGQLGQPSDTLFACYEDHTRDYPRSEWKDDARRAMVRLAGRLDREGKREYRERVRKFGEDEDDRELMQVLVALGEIGDQRSIDVILQRLAETEDEHRRARIVEVLEDIESARVLDALAQLATGDPSDNVRVAAVEALSQNEAGNPTDLLTQIATDGEQPTRVRMAAVDELSDHNPTQLLATLRQLALDADPRLADEAIDQIADLESGEALAALTDLMGQIPNAELRRNIVYQIEDFESEAAVQALLTIAQSDADPRIRRAATESLGDMESTAAREALIQLLQQMNDGDQG